MPAWKGIVNKFFTIEEFKVYCKTLNWDDWTPDFIVLHNTGAPNLEQRPHGLTAQHIQNFVTYYRDTNHWSAGPHFFVDDHGIWAFTSALFPGVHSPSWNRVSLGVEMLGDYECESFDVGRGALVHKNAVNMLATLHNALGIEASTMRMHYEDKLTTHKCPGKHVVKASIIKEIELAMVVS